MTKMPFYPFLARKRNRWTNFPAPLRWPTKHLFLIPIFLFFPKKKKILEYSHPSDLLPERRIEGSSRRNDLREAGGGGEQAAKPGAGPHIGDAVQRLRPPFVAGDPQPRHRGRVVHQQQDLLGQRQPSDQIRHAKRYRQRRLAEGQIPLVPGAGECRARVHSRCTGCYQ